MATAALDATVSDKEIIIWKYSVPEDGAVLTTMHGLLHNNYSLYGRYPTIQESLERLSQAIPTKHRTTTRHDLTRPGRVVSKRSFGYDLLLSHRARNQHMYRFLQ